MVVVVIFLFVVSVYDVGSVYDVVGGCVYDGGSGYDVVGGCVYDGGSGYDVVGGCVDTKRISKAGAFTISLGM